ncbi:MAG: Rpn family recombination-promoting nuclease/putative transposase [Microcoleus sp. PH2017_29_MFU_D_A]|uniref:Rpn family recombination-promoting nuclease/putative transposase n=1 Tax=unclassified Microcoleus TaxID=2642155 RepID=UPI001DF08297|nr:MULTISPECIES: Rpn family recombination-promoting nuclease/putative transposase [unclassified Microcoleus]MCC3583783.1 Rpn family recombination-promoting nuclease/putative transposase [Microcoleus sp. PH2017_30_WIL_O_A]MCC3602932.1 Rpn family recombination-promoting nuclease/putative transposase [Microcoleus sp. PH2017_29_MFU_D_A]MCC3634139.1 Rpn family recombination-promoting nuclease/putative transposase [Microcoleus sp. PH2017_37_MFU_D_B]
MGFINPKLYLAFTKIFCSNESREILMSFLNAMLYAGESAIEDLEIIPPYLSAEIFGSKDTYLDVKAKINDGKTVIVTIQVLNVAKYRKRVLYNAAKTYGMQLNLSDSYYRLRPVIALNITDFEMFPNQLEVISRFAFKETQRLFDYPDSEIELVFIELPKFKKELDQLTTLTDKWIYFVKNTSNLETVPDTMVAVPEIERAFQIANDTNLSQKDLDELQKQEFWIQDQQGAIDLAAQQALERGMERGMERGKSELIVRNMRRLIGEISPDIQTQICELNLENLDDLGDAMFDFESVSDLVTWLQQHSRNFTDDI